MMETFYGPDGIVENPVALAIMEFKGGQYVSKNENEAAFLRANGYSTTPPEATENTNTTKDEEEDDAL
jgi:hypothetical protein